MLMFDRSRDAVRDVLDQRSIQKHIEHLQAIANGKHGFSVQEGMVEKAAAGFVEVRVDRLHIGMSPLFVARWIDVARAAAEADPVELRGNIFARLRPQPYLHRSRSAPFP